MAIAPINLAEFLRPWQQAGLSYILTGGVAPSVASTPCAAQAQESSTPSTQDRQQRAGQPRQAVGREYPSQRGQPSASAQLETPVIRVTATGHDPDDHSWQAPVAPALTDWPAEWQTAHAKCMASQTLLVWTYWELGFDLLGHKKTSNGALLRKLIAALQLPPGSSAFWPVAMPDGDSEELLPRRDLAWAGLEQLAPRLLVVFGKEPLSVLHESLAPLRPYRQHMLGQKKVVVLPSLHTLQSTPQRFTQSIVYLQSVLRSYS